MSQPYRAGPHPTRQPRRLARAVLLVPVVAGAAILVLIRPDAIKAGAAVPPNVKWLIYDECDLTAFALRGANAAAGRRPGRDDEPNDPTLRDDPVAFVDVLDRPNPPELAERFYLEYPPAALLLFRAGFAFLPPPPLPVAVADGHQFSVAFHEPRTDAEREVWTSLGVAVRVYVAVMAAGLVGLMVVVGRGYGPRPAWDNPVWLAALPGAVFFSLNRFDVLPALATAVGFACLGGRFGKARPAAAGVAFAVGMLLKVYPVLLVPVVLRYLGIRDGLRFAVAFGLTAAGGFAATGAVLDLEAAVGPVRVQMSRTYESGSWTFYGRVLPVELAHSGRTRLAILAWVILLTAAGRPASVESVLRRAGVVLLTFVVLAVFWSPQWIVWFLPILIPLARTRRWPVAAAVALDVSNYVSFPVMFWIWWPSLPENAAIGLAEGLVYVRAAAWAGVLARFVRDEWFAPDPRAAFRAGLAGFLADFLRTAGESGKPRGLTWAAVDPAGDPTFVRDADTDRLVALVPVVVRFEVVPGSALEDVPQATEPRPVVALFAFDGGRWATDGKAVFNLGVDEVVTKSAGKFRPEPPPSSGPRPTS